MTRAKVLTPRKLANGRWEVSWRPRVGAKVGQQTTATFDTFAPAKAFAAAVEDDGRPDMPAGWTRSGRAVVRVDGIRGGRALADAIREMIDARRCTPETKRAYHGLIDNHVADTLGAKPVGDITALDVERWYADLSDRKSASTSNDCRSLVSGALTRAIRAGEHGGPNPFEGLEWAKRGKPPITALTADQWAIFHAALVHEDALRSVASWAAPADPDAFMADACDVLASTGLRFGELAALTVDDYVLPVVRRGKLAEPGYLTITKSVREGDGRRYLGPPKTLAGVRDVDVPAHVDAILERRVAAAKARKTDLLFPGLDDAWMSHDMFTKRFARALKAAKRNGLRLPVRSGRGSAFTPHGLRHTHITWLIGNGVGAVDVAKRVGHEDPKTTLTIYAKAMRDIGTRQRTMAVLDDMASPAARIRAATEREAS